MMKRLDIRMHLKRLVCRVKDAKGDTLAETLCAILVAAAAAVVLTTGVSTSAAINHKVKTSDAKLNTAREAAAEQDDAEVLGHGDITYTWEYKDSWVNGSEDRTVNFYGGHLDDEHSTGIYSYSGAWS